MKQVTPPESHPDEEVPAEDGRSSRWARHRAQRRTELVRTARAAVDDLGPHASMEEIASACRTSKSVYYRYFGDKAGLQRAVGEYTVARMRSRLEEAARAAGTFEDTVRAMVGEYLLSIERSASVYRFVVAIAPDSGRPRTDRQRHDRSRGDRTRAERSGTEDAPPAAGGGEPRYLIQEFADSAAALLADAHVRHGSGAGRLEEPMLSYWASATIGMVRGAGESWMNTPEGTERPSRERMTELIVGWAADGLLPSDAPTPAPAPAPAPEHTTT